MCPAHVLEVVLPANRVSGRAYRYHFVADGQNVILPPVYSKRCATANEPAHPCDQRPRYISDPTNILARLLRLSTGVSAAECGQRTAKR
jgi:hypothetical protein